MSKQINFLDFQLECLESPKNISIYTLFGRNRPIETIGGYDGTVYRGPFQKYRDHWISIDGLDAAIEISDKTREFLPLGSRSDALDPIPSVRSLPL